SGRLVHLFSFPTRRSSDLFPDAMKLADRVEARVKAMGLTDTESAKVLRRFEEARRERRAWLVAGGTLLAAIVVAGWIGARWVRRSEEHTSELQSPCNLVCR